MPCPSCDCLEVCGSETHTNHNKMLKAVQGFRDGTGECVLSRTAINYKASGRHVLIRGINVSSFPLHTPPFASINAAGGKEERESERTGEREKPRGVSYAAQKLTGRREKGADQ